MDIDFAQPDANTCVPTSFTYLLYKTKQNDFRKTLDLLIPECYKNYDLEKNGMEFDQMKKIADKLDIPCEFTTSKPPVKSYLVGVIQLPITKFRYTDVITRAIQEGALKIDNDYFIYPYAHSVTVFEQNDTLCTIFDSYLGKERMLTRTELSRDLEKPISYLYVK